MKEIIEELEQIKGRGTELISLYIPAGSNIDKIREQVLEEKSTAQNIKSKVTRKNVTAALEKIYQELKPIKKIPQNGLVVFCGNVAKSGEPINLKLWMVEPIEPLSLKLYHCGKEFIVEPLKEMLEAKHTYALILIDLKNACLGSLRGKTVKMIKEMESIVPPKHRAGGSSAPRFARLREEAIREWYKKVAEEAKQAFSRIEDLKGLLIGGPGGAKQELIEFLPDWLRNKIIALKDLCYTGEAGFKELIEKCEEELKEEEIIKERKAVERLLSLLGTQQVVYKEEEVKRAFEMGLLEEVLLSEELGREKINWFKERAKHYGTEVILISTKTEEGKAFKELGGIAGFLRFKLEG